MENKHKNFWEKLHYNLCDEWGPKHGDFSDVDEYGNVDCYNGDEYYPWLLEQKDRILEEITNFEEFENITKKESDDLFDRFIKLKH